MTPSKKFISYKSEQRPIAERIRDALEAWGYPTWFDQRDIPKGDFFRDAIQAGLESADVVVGILTQKALASREVLAEWDYAFSGKARLLLLRYEEVSLPYWLSGVQHIDCTADETAALERLRAALAAPDTAAINHPAPVPDHLRRHTAYQPAKYVPSQPTINQTSRSRRRVTIPLLVVIIVIIIVSLFLNDRTLTLLSTIISIILAVVELMPRKSEPEPSTPTGTAPSDKDRASMLYNVYQTWIQGALHPNLPDGAIDLGLGLKPDAVLRHVNYPDYALPESGRDIGQVFADMKGELLILGDPGGGKTILLLQLAESLLGQAQHDGTAPMPAVFNLSSWVRERKPLAEWLVDELWRGYGVPRKTGEAWVKDGRLTLLLDGLDEIAPLKDMTPGVDAAAIDERAVALRSACIDAINAYRADHPGVDIVVCSRIRDYEAIRNKLDLNAAVVLGALTDAQIAAYLDGDEHAGTRDLLADEATARAMARTPFLLTMMKAAYRGRPYRGAANRLQLPHADEPTRRDHLLNDYVELQLRQQTPADYRRGDTLRYLRWLAWQMVRTKKSVFYIEDLQPDWAINQKTYRRIYGLSCGLFFGAGFGVIGLVFAGPTGGLILWLFFGTIFEQIFEQGKEETFRIGFADRITWSWPHAVSRDRQIVGLIGGLIGGLMFGLFEGPVVGLFLGPIFGLFFGLFFGLARVTDRNLRNRPNSGVAMSLINGLMGGLMVGLTDGLSVGLMGGLMGGLGFGLMGGWLPVIYHLVLRRVLADEGVIPRGRYDGFLDYCAAVGLLRKVGGGYIFRHRMLLEYFAAQYAAERASAPDFTNRRAPL